ncbi:MAG: hypothetical protein ACJ749_02015, partial [Flavisolibacter sp.]
LTMSDKKHEFIIRFDGVHLSKEASQRIQNGISDLLTQELGNQGALSTGDDGDYCAIYVPHRWIGRQIIPVDINKNIEVVHNEARLAFVGQAQNLGR